MNYIAIAADLIAAGVTMPPNADPVELVRAILEADAERDWDAALFPSHDEQGKLRA